MWLTGCRGVNPGGFEGVFTPENMSEGSEYVLILEVSHSFIENCCWITLHVSYH